MNIDSFQAAWTQNWTPVLNTQLVLTGSLQNGFLANPYRAVIIAPAGDQALEYHPENRARGAIALRGKYFFRDLRAAITASARLYRDTWDLFGQTYELEAEKYLTADLRLMLHGRVHDQTGALFWSDDYTGGEPRRARVASTGLAIASSRHSRVTSSAAASCSRSRALRRIALQALLLGFETSVSLDFMKTDLHEFTWGGLTPDDTLAVRFSAADRRRVLTSGFACFVLVVAGWGRPGDCRRGGRRDFFLGALIRGLAGLRWVVGLVGRSRSVLPRLTLSSRSLRERGLAALAVT